MSIWATFFHLDGEQAPITYSGSHLFPSPLLRAGSVDLALIPGFINPDGPDHEDGDERAPHPLLRLSVNSETVVTRPDTGARGVRSARRLAAEDRRAGEQRVGHRQAQRRTRVRLEPLCSNGFGSPRGGRWRPNRATVEDVYVPAQPNLM